MLGSEPLGHPSGGAGSNADCLNHRSWKLTDPPVQGGDDDAGHDCCRWCPGPGAGAVAGAGGCGAPPLGLGFPARDPWGGSGWEGERCSRAPWTRLLIEQEENARLGGLQVAGFELEPLDFALFHHLLDGVVVPQADDCGYGFQAGEPL